MALKTALHQYLAGKTSVTTLVPASRIVRGKRPVGALLPSIAFWLVSDTDEDHQDGASGLAMARIQLDVWAETDTAADAIRLALRNVLHGINWTTIGTGGNATVIQSSLVENAMDAVEYPDDGTDGHRFCCSIDWVAWYQSTVPTLT